MNRPLLTLAAGIALNVVAILGFFLSISRSPTAFIPAFIGLPIAIAALLAAKPSRRKTALRVAAGFAALGFLASAGRLAGVIAKGAFAWKIGTSAQVAMALICVICLAVLVTNRQKDS